MSVEENKNLFHRSFDAFNKGDMQDFDQCFAPGHKHTTLNGEVIDHQQFMDIVKNIPVSGKPWTLDDIMAEGDRVAWRARAAFRASNQAFRRALRVQHSRQASRTGGPIGAFGM